uniref:Uncharacterized protein n=1 Tax=Acrobeloides nanus TaxID=290746 RepID=A0A914CNZ6_9BILA
MVQTFEKTFTAPSINSPACAGFTSSKASSLYPSLPKEPTAPSASVPGLDFGKNRRAPGPPRELTPTNNAVPCLGTKLSTLEIKAHKEPTVPIEGTKNLNELVRKNLKHHQQITELRLEEKSLQSNDRQHMENLVQDLRVARKCIKNQDNY